MRQRTLVWRSVAVGLVAAGPLLAMLRGTTALAQPQGRAPTPAPAAPAPAPAAPSAPASAPATQPATVTETVLYHLPQGIRVADTTASPDARHVGCVELRPDKRFTVVVDGVRSKDLEWIVGHSFRFSADSSHFGYETQHDLKVFVATGTTADPASAVEGKGYYLTGPLLFSPDGAHTAYWAQAERAGKVVMVVDGRESEPYDAIGDRETLFSPDGRHLAYQATRGKQQLFVVDGKPGPAYDAALGVMFSSDSARIAYRAKRGDEAFAVLDGHEGPHYEMVARLLFSPDGRRFAYIAGRGGKQMLLLDDAPAGAPKPREFLPFDGMGDLAFSPDSRRLCTVVKQNGKWRAVVDGKEGPPYDGLGMLIFSPDSKRLAYVAGKADRQYLVVDGKESAPFIGIGTYQFSPDSAHVLYAALAGVGGEERILVRDDAPFAPAGLFAFSPDSRHIAHAIPRPGGRWSLALDRTPIASPHGDYDGFPSNSDLVFDGPRTVRTIVGRSGELLRVEMHLAD